MIPIFFLYVLFMWLFKCICKKQYSRRPFFDKVIEGFKYNLFKNEKANIFFLLHFQKKDL